MARYRFSIDAGAYIGARLVSIPAGEGGKPVQGIFIPTGINGIDVREDSRPEGKCNHSKIRAFLNFQQRPLVAKYLSAIRDRLVARGETVTPYNVPAWSVCYTIPEERRLQIRSALKGAVLKAHPEMAGQEDVKGTALAAEISRMMPFQMGDSWLIEERQTSASPYTPAPPAHQVVGYTSVAAPPADANYAFDPDDVPF